MVAFNNPDHLDPREKGLWKDPELSRELLRFPLLFCSFMLGGKLAVLCLTVANVRSRAEKLDAGLVQCVKTWDGVMQSWTGMPCLSHAAGTRSIQTSLPLFYLLQLNIPVNSVSSFLSVLGIWQTKCLTHALQTAPGMSAAVLNMW